MTLQQFYPDFYAMLTHAATWSKCIGKDQWGNESYASPVGIKCFVTSQSTAFGSEDGQNKQDAKTVITIEMITDSIGIRPSDKIAVNGLTITVTDVDTPQDDFQRSVIHTVTGSTTSKG